MNTSNTAVFLLAGLLSLTTPMARAVTISDNFDDNIKDLAKWDEDIRIEGSSGLLNETNGRVSFRDQVPRRILIWFW